MANSPQKSDDPMADTLNAIEAALKLGDGDGDKAPAVKSPAEGNGAAVPARSEPELSVEEPPPAWQADETPPRPANDDRANVGQMLQAFHQRPASRAPFVLATIAAIAWLAGTAGTAFMFRPELQALFTTPRVSALIAIGAVAAVVLADRRLLRARLAHPPLAGDARGRRIHGRGGAAAGTAGDGGNGIRDVGRPSHPPRSRRHGRRRRARARARSRT